MATQAQLRAIRKYDDNNTKQFHLKLNMKSDSDIIERLDQAADEEGGKQGYIKGLIRKDIAQNGRPS